jgi:hypothetical protein
VSHRHICVHGHFYQPPRENPWTGAVECEESAAPFHDWNERVAEECYGPITHAAHEGTDGRDLAYDATLNRLSFDFGPTLTSWLERERPSILKRIVAADRVWRAAIAQPYFHNIMPLESRRDKETLVRWGMAEFRHRFGRPARGMWLPETAVDNETLEVLSAEGAAFTILDPKQAEAVRSPNGIWTNMDPDILYTKMPYQWTSPKDPTKKLAVFFYSRRLSRAVVTGDALASPAHLVEEVRSRFTPDDTAQLLSIASDGEFYGHHHKKIGRVLDLTLDRLVADAVTPIDYARFLDLAPPTHDVRIRERTAWSCDHGLGRWQRDCGCRSAHLSKWRQEWRTPLRTALSHLAHGIDDFYQKEAPRVLIDPWRARDESIALWLAPGDAAQRQFLRRFAKAGLNAQEQSRALRLLAMQYQRLAMFTSCGWFFDDISGVETVLCLQRAARALDIAKGLGADLEAGFVVRLNACRSNLPRFDTGVKVWTSLVLRSRVDLERAAAHAAIMDHLEIPAPEPPSLRWNMASRLREEKIGLAGRDRTLSMRLVTVSRPETSEADEYHAIVHRADRLDVSCWVVPRQNGDALASISEDFRRCADDEFHARMDARFGAPARGLDTLLPDERPEIVKVLTSEDAMGPERALFLKRWTSCVSAMRLGGRDDDAVLELLTQRSALSFRCEDLPWYWTLEQRLHERFELLIAKPHDPALASCVLRWFAALREAKLLTSPWRLRDAHQRWRSTLGDQRCAALDACRALGSRLGLAEALEETI